MTMIITGVANTGGRIASLNRFARCSGWTRRLKEPLAPRGIWRMACLQKGSRRPKGVYPCWRTISARSSAFRRLLPGTPAMIQERLKPLCAEAQHQVLAGGAIGFYGVQ